MPPGNAVGKAQKELGNRKALQLRCQGNTLEAVLIVVCHGVSSVLYAQVDPMMCIWGSRSERCSGPMVSKRKGTIELRIQLAETS